MTLQEYLNSFIKRYDDEHLVHYLNKSYFNNLHEEKKSFISSKGNKIMTFINYYDNYDPTKLIVFVHGLGGGHLSYFREIEYFCKKGYLVLSYDMTGCFESSGISILGLSQAICDLDDVLNFIKLEDFFKNKEVICIGHSMGGFAVNNIHILHKEVKKIVVISGITTINNFIKNYELNDQKDILKYEKDVNLKYALLNPINGYNDENLHALIIHSKDDNMVNFNDNAMYLYNNIKNKNVTFYFVDGKLHNPNYQKDSIQYMNDSFNKYFALLKEGKLKTYKEKKDYFDKLDFMYMTCQDEEIMNKIVNFIVK